MKIYFSVFLRRGYIVCMYVCSYNTMRFNRKFSQVCEWKTGAEMSASVYNRRRLDALNYSSSLAFSRTSGENHIRGYLQLAKSCLLSSNFWLIHMIHRFDITSTYWLALKRFHYLNKKLHIAYWQIECCQLSIEWIIVDFEAHLCGYLHTYLHTFLQYRRSFPHLWLLS